MCFLRLRISSWHVCTGYASVLTCMHRVCISSWCICSACLLRDLFIFHIYSLDWLVESCEACALLPRLQGQIYWIPSLKLAMPLGGWVWMPFLAGRLVLGVTLASTISFHPGCFHLRQPILWCILLSHIWLSSILNPHPWAALSF